MLPFVFAVMALPVVDLGARHRSGIPRRRACRGHAGGARVDWSAVAAIASSGASLLPDLGAAGGSARRGRRIARLRQVAEDCKRAARKCFRRRCIAASTTTSTPATPRATGPRAPSKPFLNRPLHVVRETLLRAATAVHLDRAGRIPEHRAALAFVAQHFAVEASCEDRDGLLRPPCDGREGGLVRGSRSGASPRRRSAPAARTEGGARPPTALAPWVEAVGEEPCVSADFTQVNAHFFRSVGHAWRSAARIDCRAHLHRPCWVAVLGFLALAHPAYSLFGLRSTDALIAGRSSGPCCSLTDSRFTERIRRQCRARLSARIPGRRSTRTAPFPQPGANAVAASAIAAPHDRAPADADSAPRRCEPAAKRPLPDRSAATAVAHGGG